jgi:hypothetical protein
MTALDILALRRWLKETHGVTNSFKGATFAVLRGLARDIIGGRPPPVQLLVVEARHTA